MTDDYKIISNIPYDRYYLSEFSSAFVKEIYGPIIPKGGHEIRRKLSISYSANQTHLKITLSVIGFKVKPWEFIVSKNEPQHIIVAIRLVTKELVKDLKKVYCL